MIPINSELIENIYHNDKVNIDLKIAKCKESLFTLINPLLPFKSLYIGISKLTENQINYVNYLYFNFEKIVTANADELLQFQGTFDCIIPVTVMRSNSCKIFRNELIEILGYRTLRNEFYPEYFEKVGIKSCVYCNSQFALTVRKVNGTKSAKFQVDHFLSKSDYPCFSISLYNLYPVCGSCNNSKSTQNVAFNLYSQNYSDYKSSKFKFEIDKKSLLKYRVNGIDSELIITFDDSASGINRIFAIEGIYNTQKDIAEEIVLKSMIYNKAYTDSLRNGLKKLYKSKSPMIERLIVGNYIDEKDIHKRPMAKFIQDIAKQLKLI